MMQRSVGATALLGMPEFVVGAQVEVGRGPPRWVRPAGEASARSPRQLDVKHGPWPGREERDLRPAPRDA
jgi:hypothetical protein